MLGMYPALTLTKASTLILSKSSEQGKSEAHVEESLSSFDLPSFPWLLG